MSEVESAMGAFVLVTVWLASSFLAAVIILCKAYRTKDINRTKIWQNHAKLMLGVLGYLSCFFGLLLVIVGRGLFGNGM